MNILTLWCKQTQMFVRFMSFTLIYNTLLKSKLIRFTVTRIRQFPVFKLLIILRLPSDLKFNKLAYQIHKQLIFAVRRVWLPGNALVPQDGAGDVSWARVGEEVGGKVSSRATTASLPNEKGPRPELRAICPWRIRAEGKSTRRSRAIWYAKLKTNIRKHV